MKDMRVVFALKVGHLVKTKAIAEKHGILTSRGMIDRTMDIIMPEPTSTNVAASPIPMPLTTVVETASVGQRPKARRKTGFSFQIPFMSSLERLIISP